MRRTRLLPLLFAVLPLSAVLALSAAARADTVGTAGAVNTATSGTAPGASTRVIEIGAQVVENEKIQTTASGSVQVLYIDKTTLNVGPNSTLVIDRFVYNPATTKGELALSLGKGGDARRRGRRDAFRGRSDPNSGRGDWLAWRHRHHLA